ncbi:Conserved_hypothetical protein [Hexamita inflata]|uniref:Myb-like domain-containing protein n=1 Tax=Hexamita inflata TaxID=28002 RepID=A0AA86U4F0_9EUKA|nr:Conserved hypothetical protein [Hexamita inflata]
MVSYNKWTQAEKELLEQLASSYHSGINWNQIAVKFVSRTPKQCYDCYTLMKKSSGFERQYIKWTKQEEDQFIEYIQKVGVNWPRIQQDLFPQRSISQLKNKYRQSIQHLMHEKPSNASVSATETTVSQVDIIEQLKMILQ